MAGKQNIGDFLAAAGLMIEGALADPGIIKLLEPYNYGTGHLEQLRQLLNEARDLTSRQTAKYGEQHAATSRLEQLRAEADELYKITRRLCRPALGEDHQARTTLRLEGPRPKSLSGWLNQATIFYDNLLGNETWLKAMSQFGYTREKLEQERAKVRAVTAAETDQEHSKGEAVTGTKERDAKIDELGKAVSNLKTVARIVLNHEQLTKLGLTGRSTSDGGSAPEEPAPPVL